jgi:ankyrin repeat protein
MSSSCLNIPGAAPSGCFPSVGNFPLLFESQTDDEGYSALQAAAENDHLAVVKLLVSKGANVAYKGEYTALQLAEMAEHDEVVVYLKTL